MELEVNMDSSGVPEGKAGGNDPVVEWLVRPSANSGVGG